MSDKKTKKEVYQPDDKLFKIVMEDKQNAAQYLKSYFPELAQKLDLSTLKILREKFSIPNLKTFDADISYRCQFKKSKEVLHINFLWENKSEPEEYVAIQIGLYLFLRYYKQVKRKNQKLEPIIPLIFYNGKKDWIPKTVSELFKHHTSLKAFESFLPEFKFHFTDVKKIPSDELLQIEMAFFKSAMVAMANKHNYDLLLQNFSVIFDLNEEDEQIAIAHYVFGMYERLPEKIRKDIIPLDYKTKSNIMSTLEMIKREGRIEGKIERDKELVQKMYKNGDSIEEIIDFLGVTKKFVLEVIEFKKKKSF